MDALLGDGFNDFEVTHLPNKGVFNFVPTVSALNVSGNPDPTTNLNGDCSNNSLYRCAASTDNSVISPYTASPEHNQDHVSLNSRIATFLLYYVKKGSNGFELNPLTDRTYNFGETDEDIDFDEDLFIPSATKDVIDYALTVEQQGRLWVNRNDKIDFTDVSTNPMNSTGSHFDLAIKNSHCDEPEVILKDGGEMIIGEWDVTNNSAIVQIEKGASLLIKAGGYAEIEQNSKIIVKDGGTLKIESGSRLRAVKGGQVIVEEGGTLEIDEGANIDLFWNQSNIHIKGQLVINGIYNFDGYGYFQFDDTHTLTLNSDFVLHGQGSRFIRLNPNTKLNIGNHLLDLGMGKVEYDYNTGIVVGQGGSVQAVEVEFSGLGSTPDENTALDISGASEIQIIKCAFDNLSTGIGIVNNFVPAAFNVYNTSFEDVRIGIDAYQLEKIVINQSDFLAGTYGSIAVSLNNVQSGGLFSSTVSGYGTNSGDIGAIYLWDVGELSLYGTEVNNNEVGIYLEDVAACVFIAERLTITRLQEYMLH